MGGPRKVVKHGSVHQAEWAKHAGALQRVMVYADDACQRCED